LTVLRAVLRWRSRHEFFGDDYFVFFGLLSLTGLSAVITCLLPQFYLAGNYQKAFMDDPRTPLPLPLDEFIERTRTALKLMFTQMLLFWTTLWAGRFGRKPMEDAVGLTLRQPSSRFFSSSNVWYKDYQDI
jgi:hypothetical protein